MFLRRFLVLVVWLAAVLVIPPAWAAEDPPELTPGQKRQLEIRRLMNIFKKAPQEDVSHQALQELYRLGVRHEEITAAIVLDHRLLDTDKMVRLRTAKILARGRHSPYIVAAQNLRNLIAAETDPDLIWTHAVALSSIDPEAGSVLDLVRTIKFDPIVRKSLWDEYAIEHQAVASGSLSIRLRLKKKPKPSDGGTVSGQFVLDEPSALSREEELRRSFGIDRGILAEPFKSGDEISYRFEFDVARPNPPSPPPQKIPAHPLIAQQRFDEILKRMDQNSDEAWELFRLFGDSFPPEPVAELHVPRAMSKVPRDRGLAMKALWCAGPDAELAAAVCYAVSHDLSIAHHVEMLERIETPGPFSRNAIKQLRNHENPRVRTAVLRAMARSPELEELFFTVLEQTIHAKDPALKIAAINMIGEQKSLTERGEEMVKEILLTEEDADVLRTAASVLRKRSMPREFQRQIFERIDSDRLAANDFILLQFLLEQIGRESEQAMKLQDQAERSLRKIHWLRTAIELEAELREIIEEAEAINRQAERAAIEQLNKLRLLD